MLAVQLKLLWGHAQQQQQQQQQKQQKQELEAYSVESDVCAR